MQYIDWPDQGIPPDPQPFISESLKSHRERERETPHTHTETERQREKRETDIMCHKSQLTRIMCVCVW